MRSDGDFCRPFLISVSLIALMAGIPAAALASSSASGLPVAGSAALFAAAAKPAKGQKETGATLLRSTQRALSLVATSVKKADKASLNRSAPFLKAIKEADRALKALKDATAAKDAKKLSRAVSAASKAVGKLNSTYKRANLTNKNVKEGMRALNAAWPQTQKRLAGTPKKVTPATTKANSRRITAVKKRMEKQRQRPGIKKTELDELVYFIAELDRALTLNRSPEYQWEAIAVLDSCYGGYDGYYEYMAVYEPEEAAYYAEDVEYWESVDTAAQDDYDTYYDDYSFESYEESVTVETTVNIEINVTNVDVEIVEAADSSIDTVEEEVTEVAAETEGYQELEAVEATDQASGPEAIEDPADVADTEADQLADTPVSEEQAEEAADELVDDQADEGQDEAEAQPESEPEPEMEPEPEPEPEMEAEPEPEPEMEPEPEPEPEPEMEPEPEPEPEMEPEPEPEPEMEPEPEPEPEMPADVSGGEDE